MIKTSMVQNVALLVAAVAVGILGLEAFLRVFPQLLPEEARLRLHWSDVREGKDVNDQVMVVADPYLGFRYRPNFTGHLRRGDLDFAFTTDEKGFRNDSPSPEAADIVVVGDSMAFGYGVPDEATWSHRVATQLDGYTLRNFGLIGGAPQQYLRVLKREALELNPKLVLFMLFPGNDLDDARVFKDWLEAHSDITYPEWRIAGGAPPSPWNALERLSHGSYLVAFQRALRSSLLSRELGETITFGDGQQLQLAPAVYDGNARMAHPSHPIFQLLMTTIEKAQRLSQRQGSHFLVLLMPTKEEVYLPLLDKPAPALIENFRPALETQHIPYIDLTPYFQARAREVGPLFFEVDGHPNPSGYQLIADVVLEYLNEHGAVYGLGDWQPHHSSYNHFQASCSDRPAGSDPRHGFASRDHEATIWPMTAASMLVTDALSTGPPQPPAGWGDAPGCGAELNRLRAARTKPWP
jgi:GDSL-like Lipase/Acylhydrolase family